MKKFFHIAMIATLALASCTALEDVDMPALPQVENHEIAFRATAQYSAKANQGETIFSGNEMSVAAYNVTSSSDYFTGASFNKGASLYAGGKYWPNTVSYINFLAYAGKEAASFTSANQFVVEIPATNKSSQNDYFYAIGHGEVSQSAGALTYPKDVDLVFKHAQALVTFSVNAGAEYEIASITLTGASFGGTLTVNQSNYNTKSGQSAQVTWSNITAAESAVVPAEGLKVVPQAMAASGFKVVYNVNGKENYFTYFFSADEKNFEAGMNYNFNLDFTNGIAVSSSASNWINE